MHIKVDWFEIPVLDFDRAKDFYSNIFQIEMKEWELDGYRMAFFPKGEDNTTGTIIFGPDCVPSTVGVCLYLGTGEDLQIILDRVFEAGGRIALEKTFIHEDHGYYAYFYDTEGNRIALHSNQ
jgi:predicted enzyme related to lactoylglutathione lyase